MDTVWNSATAKGIRKAVGHRSVAVAVGAVVIDTMAIVAFVVVVVRERKNDDPRHALPPVLQASTLHQ